MVCRYLRGVGSRICEFSPAGTAELSPGRQSWVGFERTIKSRRDGWKLGRHVIPGQPSAVPLGPNSEREFSHTLQRPDEFAWLQVSKARPGAPFAFPGLNWFGTPKALGIRLSSSSAGCKVSESSRGDCSRAWGEVLVGLCGIIRFRDHSPQIITC